MNTIRFLLCGLTALTSIGFSSTIVTSPGNTLSVAFTLEDGQPNWRLSFSGKQYINASRLGLEISPNPLGPLETVSQKQRTVRETVKTVWGKFSSYDNHFTDTLWTLRETAGLKRTIEINARLYDSGIGIRYRFPYDGGWEDEIVLTGDRTEFCFADDYTGFSYRRERDPLGPQPLSKFGDCLLPLTIKCSPNAYMAVLEAAVFNEAPLLLKRSESSRTAFVAGFAISTIQRDKATSWRTVLVGKTPGDLLVSPVIYCLNPACMIKDPSWIRPGLAFWDWRAWGAETQDGFTYALDMASWRRFIDFASKNNIRYLVLDANWYGPESDKNSDPRTSRDHLVIQPNPNRPNLKRIPAPKDWKDPIDVPEIIKYGKDRNVGLILYFNDIARLNYPFEETLALYQKWGAAGIKYGFMKGRDRQKVLDTRKIVELCAKYELLCDFHDGPVPPSGDRRTWPNYVVREFCHSQSDAMRVFSPTGFCEQVFVNMLAGPLDMCNGMYTLENPAADRPKIFKNIDTTVVAETARTMITFSGLSILPDCPEAYQAKADLFDFLTRLPMDWDETKILHSSIGEYITTARRKGNNWYIASATNEQSRKLEIKLDFLRPRRKYSAILYEDAADAHFKTNREAYTVRKTTVTADDTVTAVMAAGGGHCIYLEMQ
ncbi:MAG: glycoside hydrolase family 97 catalytic domain-containing protein [Planctomycetes bacterium]|nr:glycoside hydrolase family 97 catalytic domain-containing protein [Planctomycetota bacterium]